MIKLIKELFFLLSPDQRKRFYILQILVMLMAFSEILGVASIAPFMTLVGDISALEGDNFIAKLYTLSGYQSPYSFLIFLGLVVLCFLALSTAISMITVWKLALFASQVGTELGDRLFQYYVSRPWVFHVTENSASLTKQIATEATRVTDLIIQPLMQMNSRIVLIIVLSVALMVYNTAVALVGLIFFVFSYLALYKFVRGRLIKNGQKISESSGQRFKLMSEAFGGAKDIILYSRQTYYVSQFKEAGKIFSYARGRNNGLWQTPRYLMEFLAFGSMVCLVLYLMAFREDSVSEVLPVVSVYAFAGFKLLPAIQLVYSSLSQIRGNIAAFEAIKVDLISSQPPPIQENDPVEITPLVFKESIRLENVSFTYPGKSKSALKNISLEIPLNSVSGFVGPSGSGKSTVVDILMGFFLPGSGSLIVDDVVLDTRNIDRWRALIGFVSQSIYLTEGTIAENVAFGMTASEIDKERVIESLQLAHLESFVLGLESGINTRVGERGVQLSGGQRQRIGIARALYHDPDVLVFDEATSALDDVTEKLIMEAISSFSGKKTIILIAHRLNTVETCDQIFFIDDGKLADCGRFSDLVSRNPFFGDQSVNPSECGLGIE